MGEQHIQGKSSAKQQSNIGILRSCQELRADPSQRVSSQTHIQGNPWLIQKYILQNLKPLIHENSLTEEDKTAISKAGKEKYLNDGEFYDGYFYRTVEGYILP